MIENTQIYVQQVIHKQQKRLKLIYPYHKGNKTDLKVRKLAGCLWSKTMKSWHLPYRPDYIEYLKKELNIAIFDFAQQTKIEEKKIIKNAVIIVDKKQEKIYLKLNDDITIREKLNLIDRSYRVPNYPKWIFTGSNENYLRIIEILEENKYKFRIENKKDIDDEQENPIVKHFVQTMIMRNNSIKTIEIYTPIFKKFVSTFKGKDITKLTYNEINSYVQHQISKNNLSEQQQRHLISALKYYFENILDREKLYFNLKKEIKTIEINTIFSFSEIIEISKPIQNTKERLLIVFKYFFGLNFLKISELTLAESKKNLKSIQEPTNKTILTNYLKDYYENYKPEKYLFETESNKNCTEQQIETYICGITYKYQLVVIYKEEYLQICKQAGFQENSTKNYLSYFLTFLKHFKFVHPLTIKNEDIRTFLIQLNKKNYSKNTINQYINSIKIYYERAHKREIPNTYIFRPKRPKKLPEILSLNEIQMLLAQIKNLKHHCLLALTYSGGLRRSETLNLKINDIDFERNEIRIRGGKGKKDRITLLSNFIKKILLKYFAEYKPKLYIFEGATGGKYSTSSMNNILKKALKDAKINKHITLHSLRHSFATHLLEQGTDLRFIQELLGHENIKTTIKYTHVAHKEIKKIMNPFDSLNLSNNDNNKPP